MSLTYNTGKTVFIYRVMTGWLHLAWGWVWGTVQPRKQSDPQQSCSNLQMMDSDSWFGLQHVLSPLTIQVFQEREQIDKENLKLTTGIYTTTMYHPPLIWGHCRSTSLSWENHKFWVNYLEKLESNFSDKLNTYLLTKTFS